MRKADEKIWSLTAPTVPAQPSRAKSPKVLARLARIKAQNELDEARRRGLKLERKAPRQWIMVRHVCKICCGRIMKCDEAYRCSSCGIESLGRPQIICGCGIVTGSAHRHRCARNPQRSPMNPAEWVIVFDGREGVIGDDPAIESPASAGDDNQQPDQGAAAVELAEDSEA